MSDLMSLLRESILVQAIITLVSLSTLMYMFATGKPVPPELLAIVMTVTGFYFGQRSAARADAVLTKAQSLVDSTNRSA